MFSLNTLTTFGGTLFNVWKLAEWPQPSFVPAVYMLCRREFNGSVAILYVGECEDIADRITPRHHKLRDALKAGMNEIHVHWHYGNNQQRLDLETKLRHHYNPPLNDQGDGAFAFKLPANALAPDSAFKPSRSKRLWEF
jgi:hypothetical protein